MKLKRTFHAVGQGGFMTETHYNKLSGTSFFTIIYDCGSTSFYAKEEVEKFLDQNLGSTPINMLVISHFDVDHINWIQYLKKAHSIDNVVMPHLKPEIKILYTIRTQLDSRIDDSNKKEIIELLNNPKEYFGTSTTITYVKSPYDKEHKDADASNIKVIKSGEKLSSTLEEWSYIPFNTYNTSSFNHIENEFREKAIDPSMLKDVNYFEANREEIQNTYESLGNVDEMSLLLFSVPASEESLWEHITCHFPSPCTFLKDLKYCAKDVGCLYLGDTQLSGELITDLKELLVSNKLNENIISTIQVPQHGARATFTSDIFDIAHPICNYVINYGTGNNMGHPSKEVVKNILDKKNTCFSNLVLVDEKSPSYVEELEF